MMLHRTGSLRALKISVGGCDVASMVMAPGLGKGSALSCCERRITFTTMIRHAVMRAEPSVPGRAPAEDIRARELVAEAHAIGRVQQQLIERITAGIRSEQLPPPSAA